MPTLRRMLNPNSISLAELIGPTDDEESFISADINVQHRDLVVRSWSLGPEHASVDPEANAKYWQDLSAAWDITEAEARRRLCANCEYFNNTPEQMEQMETIPLDKFDLDGGGRGFCTKFDFICHNLRVCQAWERKDFEEPDGNEA